MTLKKIKELNKLVKLAPLCARIGMNVESLKSRLKRGTPELTADEGERIYKELEKILNEFKKLKY